MSRRSLASRFHRYWRSPAFSASPCIETATCIHRPDADREGACYNPSTSIRVPVGESRLFRGFSSTVDGLSKPLSVAEAQEILKKIDAAQIGDIIKREGTQRWNMSYDDLIKLCCDSDIAPSREDAQQVCDALDRAGVVLRVKNLVYLRPLEVAEILYQALPDTDQEILAKVDQLKKEAEPLLEQKARIDSHAHRVSKAVLWTGLAIFTAQVVLYARLTFWELSWDVMEPVTYFTSATFAILAYIYCLWYNEEFGYQKARSRIHVSIQNKKYAEKGLNKAKLDYLLERIHHLQQTLSPRHYGHDTVEDREGESDSSGFPAAARPGLTKNVPAA